MHVLEMHSRLSQAQRSKTTAMFAKEPGHVMFASDVIARGMDFPDVSLVVQVSVDSGICWFICGFCWQMSVCCDFECINRHHSDKLLPDVSSWCRSVLRVLIVGLYAVSVGTRDLLRP